MILTVATPGHYEDLADRCADSFLPDFEVLRIIYEDKGSWELNCLGKPHAAEQAWHEWNILEPLWLLDADIVYNGGDLKPLLSLLDHADMAVHVHDVRQHENKWRRGRTDSQVSAGVVGFAPTKFARAALAYWAQSCLEWRPEWTGQGGIQLPEQHLLRDAMQLCEEIHGIVAPIDLRFNCRPQSAGEPWDLPDEDCVLMHAPASRELRKQGRI